MQEGRGAAPSRSLTFRLFRRALALRWRVAASTASLRGLLRGLLRDAPRLGLWAEFALGWRNTGRAALGSRLGLGLALTFGSWLRFTWRLGRRRPSWPLRRGLCLGLIGLRSDEAFRMRRPTRALILVARSAGRLLASSLCPRGTSWAVVSLGTVVLSRSARLGPSVLLGAPL